MSAVPMAPSIFFQLSCLSLAWQPTPVLLSGEHHRKKSLVGYSPWGHKESDITEATKHAITAGHLLFLQPRARILLG